MTISTADRPAPTGRRRSRTTAAALAILMGGAGVLGTALPATAWHDLPLLPLPAPLDPAKVPFLVKEDVRVGPHSIIFMCPKVDNGDGVDGTWAEEPTGMSWTALVGGENHDAGAGGVYNMWNTKSSTDYNATPLYQVGGTHSLAVTCIYPSGTSTATFGVKVEFSAVATTTAVSVTPSSLVSGRTATISATVGGGAPAGGTVQFFLDGSQIGTSTLDSAGAATLQHTFTAAGTVTATYGGTTGYLPSSSSGVAVAVTTDVTSPAVVVLSTPPVVGVPLSVLPGDWTPSVADGTELTFTWKVDGVVVGTSPSYTPKPADAGRTLTAEVHGSHPNLPPTTAKTVVSAGATVERGTMVRGELALAGLSDGAAVLDGPITVDASGWPQGAAIGYQWTVGHELVDVPGATFTPRAADLGRPIGVTVTVSAPGLNDVVEQLSAGPAVTTPTVSVGSPTVAAGADATVPVTVSGPTGGPVATGAVTLTLASSEGDPIVVGPVALDGTGQASIDVPALAVGTYGVRADYAPGSAPLTKDTHAALANPYLSASGTATVEVQRVVPTVAVARSVTIAVATPGTFVARVTGSQLPGHYVVREGATVLLEGTVPADGVTTVELPVLAPGTHDLVLEFPQTATTSAVSAEIRATVAGEPGRATPLPTAHLTSPREATATGDAMELVADGFVAGETLAFYLHSTPMFLGTAVAGADGTARLTVTIPADAVAGKHTVVATGGTSGRWAVLAVELAAPTTPSKGSTPSDQHSPAVQTGAEVSDDRASRSGPRAGGTAAQQLATTGSETAGLLTVAWLLLSVGAGMVHITRRMRARA